MTQWLRVLWPVGYAGKFAHLLFFCHKSGMVMPKAGNLRQFVQGTWLEINGCTIADRTMLWLYQDSAMNVLCMIVLMVVLGCALVSRSSQTDPSQRREISLPPPSFLSFTISSNLDELHFGQIIPWVRWWLATGLPLLYFDLRILVFASGIFCYSQSFRQKCQELDISRSGKCMRWRCLFVRRSEMRRKDGVCLSDVQGCVTSTRSRDMWGTMRYCDVLWGIMRSSQVLWGIRRYYEVRTTRVCHLPA